MRDNGYVVEVVDVDNLGIVKTEYAIPYELQSCHTAIVDGYIIEGHVSVAEIEKLLAERPAITGLAVPGMPMGSPGMEGANTQAYDVIAFKESGETEIFASYGK